MPLDRHTEFSITDPAALRADLMAARERGYAIIISEEVLRVNGIAAPIFGRDGYVVGGINLWGPESHATAETLREKSALLLETAGAISEKMGCL